MLDIVLGNTIIWNIPYLLHALSVLPFSLNYFKLSAPNSIS